MPRRRPHALRSALHARRPSRPRHPAIDRLSGSCHAAIARLERESLWPGAVFEAFHRWKAFAHGPQRNLTDIPVAGCSIPECCGAPDADRDVLEAALHRLPRKPALELRVLVSVLDETVLARAVVIPGHPSDQRWWRNW
ncbi:hypothetical protein [Streptomyces meridianus]|uniref:Uncharacterized protein n=1 Tax=Streptomyces meridianus TaxID=2938945 RepID=A0ABT0X4V0_9ACTN|nr:hypothetical protein [Streptomyces meridianus]MCM2577570.1 hypothetical protein [Streptomyces meridianus]